MKASLEIKVILLSLIAVFVCSAAITTMAFLKDETETLENTFALGNVTTKVDEVFESTDVATVFKKEPVVVNTGKNDCYVRVRVNISPENQIEIKGLDLADWEYNADGGFYYNDNGWMYKGGYYYYQDVLKAVTDENYNKTTPLFTEISVKEDYIDIMEGFEVTVYQEAVQAKMSAKDGTTTTEMEKIWEVYDSGEVPTTFLENSTKDE